MRILLVEDEKTIALTLSDDLEEAGHEVVLLDEGRRALQRIREESFDCLITDLRLLIEQVESISSRRSRAESGGTNGAPGC